MKAVYDEVKNHISKIESTNRDIRQLEFCLDSMKNKKDSLIFMYDIPVAIDSEVLAPFIKDTVKRLKEIVEKSNDEINNWCTAIREENK